MNLDQSAADIIVQEALKLSLAERIEVLHRLWQSLPSDSVSALLPDDLLEELEQRAADEDVHPEEELTWEQVKAAVPRPR